jgi:hypothetical protein
MEPRAAGDAIVWSLPPSSAIVWRVCFDGWFELRLKVGSEYLDLKIAGDFRLEQKDGTVAVFALGEASPSQLAQLLELRRESVLGCYARADGELILEFQRTVLKVPSSPAYDAWELLGLDGVYVVSLAGGEVSLFEDRPTE